MWNFEKHLLDNCTDKPFLYLLYIDDILVIYICHMSSICDEKLEQFHENVNGILPNIKLTLTTSATNISYLDVSVSFDCINIHTSACKNPLTDIDNSITMAFTRYTS